MTDRELTFISSLLGGPTSPASIQLARTTRKRIMRKLEERGYTERRDNRWKLTKAGYLFAIHDLGMTLPAPAYALPDIRDEETDDDIIATIQEAANALERGDSSMAWIIKYPKIVAAWTLKPILIGLSLSVAMTTTLRMIGYW